MVTDTAASGKGKLRFCKKLIEPIHNKQLENTSEEVVSFILPANSSSTGVYELLNNNNGEGIIFETEGDTMSQMFKQDFGNYSDGLRKASHHESITFFRRKDSELVNIIEPRLSVLLAGTPEQTLNLIPSVENGLASRFLYYNYQPKSNWVDPFSNNIDDSYDSKFQNLGSILLDQIDINSAPKKFKLNINQQTIFNERFEDFLKEFVSSYGEGFRPFVKRAGLATFRICMTLTAVRNLYSKSTEEVVFAEDEDLDTAIKLIKALLKSAGEVYTNLSRKSGSNRFKSEMEFKLYNNLSHEFSKQDYLVVAENLQINHKTAKVKLSTRDTRISLG